MRKNKYILLLVLNFFLMSPPLWGPCKVYSSNNTEALRAYDLAESEKYDEANKIIDAILAKEPDNSLAYYIKGHIQHKTEELDLAIQSYTRAIDLDNTNKVEVLAYSGRGNCWREKHVYYKAVYDFTKVIELEPANTIAYYDRARVWILLGESQAAIKDYTKLISINSSDVDAYAKRSILFIKKGKWNLALADLKKIIELDSKNSQKN